MEKNNVFTSYDGLVNGERELQIPIGFRFRPTDEELIIHYLNPKAHSVALPANFIPEVDDIFRFHPSHLSGDANEKRYFFCKRRWDYSKASRSRIYNISDGSGYWKRVGKEKNITIEVAPKTSYVLGTKKSFVFYQGKCPHGSKTSWIMREYGLLPSQISASCTRDSENWVVYGIHQRKRKARANVGEVGAAMMEFTSIDDSSEFVYSPLSTSPLLCSSNEEDEEEA